MNIAREIEALEELARECRGIEGLGSEVIGIRLQKILAALRERVMGAAGPIDYVPGELDRTAPERIWLQIDTGGSNDERDEPWPGADGVTWQDEEIGGLEIQYIRADLAAPAAPAAVVDEGEVSRLKDALGDIANYAHNNSSGPEVPDDLWEVRRLAYAALFGNPSSTAAVVDDAQGEIKHLRGLLRECMAANWRTNDNTLWPRLAAALSGKQGEPT